MKVKLKTIAVKASTIPRLRKLGKERSPKLSIGAMVTALALEEVERVKIKPATDGL